MTTIKTELQLTNNKGEMETLLIEAEYSPAVFPIEPEQILITSVSLKVANRFIAGSLSLTWLFIFNKVFSTNTEFEERLESAVRKQYFDNLLYSFKA
jgi:hypothetical protein